MKKVKTLSEIVYDNKPSKLPQSKISELFSVYSQVCDNDIIMDCFDEPMYFVTRKWMKIEGVNVPRPQTVEEYIYICRVFCCDLIWSDKYWVKFKGL